MQYIRQHIIEKISNFIDKPFIKVLNGLRRSGKSTILDLLTDHLLKLGVSRDQIIKINFESMQFSSIQEANELYDYVQSRIQGNNTSYLLLDEIQEVNQWEKAVNSFLVDFDADIYITGSNSKLLSSELSTHLAGRYVEFHIQPLSFAETIDFYKQRHGDSLSLIKYFERYRKLGGFPALHIADYDNDSAYKIVFDIYSSTILRDTVQRFGIRNIDLLERIVKFAIENIGHTFSAHSIAKYFKSQYRKVDINTVYNYLNALESSYIFYKVNRYDLKGKEILKTQEKYFPGDFAFVYSLMGYKYDQVSGVLETMVFLELKRRGYKVFIGKIGSKEIDFIGEKNNGKIYVQVTYKLSSQETIEREFSPLAAIKDSYPKYVVSLEDVWQENFEGIKHMHMADFLLSKSY